MKRRRFVKLLANAAVAYPLFARAQQRPASRRIAWLDLFPESDPNAQARKQAFNEVMEKRGWKIGSNLVIDYRWGLFDETKARLAGSEVLDMHPDLILCGGTPAALAMKQATRTVPIVFAIVNDPVSQGIVASLARPTGNITGFSYFEPTIGAKWLALLKEIAPTTSRVALMFNPDSGPYSRLFYQSIEAASPKLSVVPSVAVVRHVSDVEKIISALARQPRSGLICSADSFIYTNRKFIIETALRQRVPAIYGIPGTAADGGLMYYCVDIVDSYRKAAEYVDRILRGEKPASLPVQQPTKFHMSINSKTAVALGITVPDTLLLSADEVIR